MGSIVTEGDLHSSRGIAPYKVTMKRQSGLPPTIIAVLKSPDEILDANLIPSGLLPRLRSRIMSCEHYYDLSFDLGNVRIYCQPPF